MIAHVLVLVAQHAVGADAATLTRLKRFRSKVTPRSAGLRQKPQTALRQFADRANIEKLLLLPHRIQNRLRRTSEPSADDARLMQVAVGLELLLMRPIRRNNLVSLQLGKHVIRSGDKIVIVLDEAEVKNGVGHEYTLPKEATQLLTHYINSYLPLFGA